MHNQIKTLDQLKDSRILYDHTVPAFGYILLVVLTIMIAAVISWSIYAPKTYIIKAQGAVESNNKNYVMSEFSGIIYDLNIEEGSVVDEGDILFRIKSTDFNVQSVQLEEQKQTYEKRIEQYQKLVQSIEDDTNYFDIANEDESLYYNQYEAYKSQIAQNKFDASAYTAYGYTEEQVENEMKKNQAKITEIYYNAMTSARNSVEEAKSQLETIEAQLAALGTGKEEYSVTAKTSVTIEPQPTDATTLIPFFKRCARIPKIQV